MSEKTSFKPKEALGAQTNSRPDLRPSLRWYADNSELPTLAGVASPNILLFGGIVSSTPAERELCHKLTAIKRSYRDDGHFPLKWNFKDLKRKFAERNDMRLFEVLHEDQQSWRRKIIDAVASVGCSIMVSVLECHGKSRDSLNRTKGDLAGLVFATNLMRLGFLAKEQRATHFEVILDWPDGDNSTAYDHQYRSGLNRGRTFGEKPIKFACGPLRELNFAEIPLYTHMMYSPMLQSSDIVVGAARDYIQVVMSAEGAPCLFDKLVPKLHGFPNTPWYGLNVSPLKGDLSAKVKQRLANSKPDLK